MSRNGMSGQSQIAPHSRLAELYREHVRLLRWHASRVMRHSYEKSKEPMDAVHDAVLRLLDKNPRALSKSLLVTAARARAINAVRDSQKHFEPYGEFKEPKRRGYGHSDAIFPTQIFGVRLGEIERMEDDVVQEG
jgi:DNA-directed RNA polymerase specialized sigma24 family protein